ncbi:MAG TPA: hypothetical protein VNN10_00555 [Dehalococcoidia bacterium]|nr:hypothetical protein [Dehalococcoidia bacterium]
MSDDFDLALACTVQDFEAVFAAYRSVELWPQFLKRQWGRVFMYAATSRDHPPVPDDLGDELARKESPRRQAIALIARARAAVSVAQARSRSALGASS